MNEMDKLLSDIDCAVSSPDDCDDLQPNIALGIDSKEGDQRSQIDSIGAMDCGVDSIQQGANVVGALPELVNNESPTDLYSEHLPTIVQSTGNNHMTAARVNGDHGEGIQLENAKCQSDHGEICFPGDQHPVDDVPLLDLSADNPLIQASPTGSEINQMSTFTDIDSTQPQNTIQAEIFSQIYSTAARHDQDSDDKSNCCDTSCGRACYFVDNEGCRMRPLLTETLKRGRDIGWIVFCGIVFPLVSVINRRVWIASQWLSAVILVCLSIATIMANGTEILYIVDILLCGVFVVYCAVDTVGTEVCHFQLRNKRGKLYTQHVAREDDDSGDEQAANRLKKWQKMINILDFIRLVVPELVLFPVVVCDLYSLVVYRSYSGQPTTHLINFVRLLVSCIALIIHSHVVRLAVIVTTAHRLHTQRTPPIELLEPDNPSNEASQPPVFDSSLKQAGLRYWKVFIIHVILQIVNQTLVTIALGFKLQEYLVWTEAPNHDPNLYFNEKSTIRVELAFFVAGAYFLPICGFWLFFAVTHYWFHEFLIGLTVDFISMLQQPGASQYFFTLDVDSGDEKLTKIMGYIDFDNLKRDYSEFRVIQTFIDKGLYPFRNYILTLLCIAYLMLQIVYLSFAMLDIRNRDTVTAIVYIIAVIGEVVSSFSAFIVGVFWILFFSIVLLLLCGMCAKQCESPTHYNYTLRPYNSYPLQQPYLTRQNPIRQQPYFTSGPRHMPGLNQPLTAARGQPTYYPSYVTSEWPTTGRGQMILPQSSPRTYTANPSWAV